MDTEGGICELKIGSSRKVTKMNSPKVLWGDYLELEAYIRSNTSLNIFEVKGINPETKMSVETSYITNFYEFGWYHWVYFRNTSVTFPGDKLFLGR